jgi:23S rRNA (pseudouridine1915-N3)-methyltransferase
MPIHVLAVGKKHESWVADGIERYQKRLKSPFNFEWLLIPHSSLEGLSARQEESGRVLSRLNGYDYIVLLDERGKMIDSPTLAVMLEDSLNSSQKICIIIGGAYGVSDEVRSKVQFVWSFSPLVFPHQLVRLMLTEQLYRAQEITRNSSYHHD